MLPIYLIDCLNWIPLRVYVCVCSRLNVSSLGEINVKRISKMWQMLKEKNNNIIGSKVGIKFKSEQRDTKFLREHENSKKAVNLWVIGCNNSETVKFYGCCNEFYPKYRTELCCTQLSSAKHIAFEFIVLLVIQSVGFDFAGTCGSCFLPAASISLHIHFIHNIYLSIYLTFSAFISDIYKSSGDKKRLIF